MTGEPNGVGADVLGELERGAQPWWATMTAS
jgi:hypothetical protein